MTGFWFLVFGFWFLVSGAQSSADLTSYLDKPIARVEIFYGGTPLTPAESQIEGLIGIRVGERLSLPAIRAAIVRLYESGQASDVAVTAEGSPFNFALRFDITPQPSVSQIIFEGVAQEIEDQLRRRLTLLEPGIRVTPGRLNRAAEEIVEFYHSLGYFDAEAIPSTSLEAGGRRATAIFRVHSGERATIETIEFEGNLKIDPQQALLNFKSDPGDPYRATVLQEDLQTLRTLLIERGYCAPQISSVRIVRDPEKNAVKITIPVDAGPRVELRVEGVRLSDNRKKELFPTLRVGGIDPATLEEGRLNLLDYLQRQGRFFAEVSYSTPVETPEQAQIVYEVAPGRKYDLQEVRIEGTQAVSYKDVQQELGSKPGGFLSRGLTSRELLEQDRRVIVDFLRARGYLKATVVETSEAVGLNREDLVIVHVVEEGPRGKIAEIVFQGTQGFSREALLSHLRLKEGHFLVQPQVSEDAGRLVAFYGSHGYAEAEVTPRLEEMNGGDVRLVFEIREGNQLNINRVLVTGNQITHEAAIDKYLTFREGEQLVNERLTESEQNLYTTSAFRRVSITKEPAGVGPEYVNKRNVLVQVAEVPRYVLTYGFGYRTDDGPRGLFEISNTNLLGRLYTGSFRIRASRREQLGQLSFTNPRPWGRKLPTLLSTFFQRENRPAFDASRLTAIAQVERELDVRSLFVFRYSFSNVIVSNVTQPSEQRREDTTRRIGRLSGTYLRDVRNSVLDPSEGNFTSLDLSLASAVFGGNVNFIRFFGEHQRYYKVPKLPSIVFATDIRLGLAEPFGRSETIPISERFFTGGSTTLRGFGFEEAGPRGPDPNEAGQTKPLGGNALAIFNAELRFPIWERLRLGGTLFYDTGNVFALLKDIELRKFTHTVGIGLRINTPVGPVRIDFGMLVRREPLVPRTRIHLSFGPPF
jgi:outer membrane protein insertion porin family